MNYKKIKGRPVNKLLLDNCGRWFEFIICWAMIPKRCLVDTWLTGFFFLLIMCITFNLTNLYFNVSGSMLFAIKTISLFHSFHQTSSLHSLFFHTCPLSHNSCTFSLATPFQHYHSLFIYYKQMNIGHTYVTSTESTL